MFLRSRAIQNKIEIVVNIFLYNIVKYDVVDFIFTEKIACIIDLCILLIL